MQARKGICVGLGLAAGITVLLVVSEYHSDSNLPIKTDDYGRPVLTICHETIRGKINPDGEVDMRSQYRQQCTKDLRPLFSQYVVLKNDVYWMEQNSYEHSPCIGGTGDSTALFYNLSWECMTAKPRQVNAIEERQLYPVARNAPEFKPLKANEVNPPEWQSAQLADYAKDAKSVYYRRSKIEGADPKQFQVIFPFGNEEKWRHFAVSDSGGETFVGGKSIGSVDLHQFRLLTPVACPKHGLSQCTAYDDADVFFLYGNWDGGVLGQLGHDVVFLQQDKISQFSNMASADMFMFANSKRIYLYTRGEFYELSNDAVYPGKKLINMNTQFFEQNY
ncbi:TPA: DKNYY domain-containing protein [Serratia fonticola]